jgi:hypothetical protein
MLIDQGYIWYNLWVKGIFSSQPDRDGRWMGLCLRDSFPALKEPLMGAWSY